MKPFMGIDFTYDKTNDDTNGDELLMDVPDPECVTPYLEACTKAYDTTKRAKLPAFFQGLQWLSGVAGLIFSAAIVKAMLDFNTWNLPLLLQTNLVLFWVTGISLALWCILKLTGYLKEKIVMGKKENIGLFGSLESLADNIYESMGVPEDAPEVDILSFHYTAKAGKIKVHDNGTQYALYRNLIFKVHTDGRFLYLTNTEGQYAISLSGIRKIHTIRKGIEVTGWNKDIQPSQGRYKPYKITINNFDCAHFKTYHILEVMEEDTLWGIYFPCYELPVMEDLTGIKA